MSQFLIKLVGCNIEQYIHYLGILMPYQCGVVSERGNIYLNSQFKILYASASFHTHTLEAYQTREAYKYNEGADEEMRDSNQKLSIFAYNYIYGDG